MNSAMNYPSFSLCYRSVFAAFGSPCSIGRPFWIVALCLAMSWQTLVAGPMVLPLFTRATAEAQTAQAVPEKSSRLQLNTAYFDQLNIQRLNEIDIPDFPMSDGQHVLHCQKMDVLAPAAQVCEGTIDGDIQRSVDKHLIVRGYVDGIANSYVYLCFFRSYVMGYVEIQEAQGTKRILVAPDDIRSEHPVMIVYNQRDMPIPPHPSCHAEDQPDYQMRVDQMLQSLGDYTKDKGNSLQNAQTLLANVAVDCDTKYYVEQNSNFSQAANYILITLGAVSAVYERDVNVRIQVPYLRIWTDNCPYTGDLGQMLNQVAGYWNNNMQSVKRTTTYLVTSYNGGLAWVGVLCGGYAYSVGGIAGGTNFPVSSYAWDVDVMAHEIGHNFGSPHTHSCSWNPPVDSCVNAEGGCYTKPLPRSGTIMSYCHLTSYGTELRFHPRVATLLRSAARKVLGNCMRNADFRYATDCALSAILQPANGAVIAAQKRFAPQVMITNLGLTQAQSVVITFRITDPAGGTVYYTNSKTIASLDTSASVLQSFDTCALALGTYLATASISLTSDGDLANNSLTRPFLIGNGTNSSVHLTYPNGGEQLKVDSVVSISWTQSSIDKMIIELSTNGGQTWQSVQTFYNAASLSYQWKVPAVLTKRALIRLVDMKNSSTRDQSDAVFSIDLDHDYQALEFVTPASDTTITAPFTPRVSFRNNGNAESAARVVFALYWRSSGQEVVRQSIDMPFVPKGQTTTVSFAPVTELPPGQFIMYAKIISSDDRNHSNDSLGRSFSHNGGIAPPVGLRAQPINNAVLLWWGPSSNSDVDSYVIQRSTDGSALTNLATLSSRLLSYVDESAQNDHDYSYVVIAMRKTQKSINSNRVTVRPTFRVLYDSLTAIKALVPENAAKSVPNPARFVWSNTTGAVWYQVQVSQGSDMSNLVYNGILSDRQPISLTLVFRQNYCWRVRALNYAMITPWSSPNIFTLGTSCAGNGLNFSKTSDRLTASTVSWPGDGPVTVEFWNYVKSADLASEQVALRVGADIATNRFLIHAPFMDGNLYWDYGNINTTGRISVDYKPYLDKWTHVCVVSDGTSFKAIYLDGQLVASSVTADAPTKLSGLYLGLTYLGRMDEFRVWNRVRTADEIFASMTKHIEAGASNLAISYRFDEPLQDTILGDQGSMQAPAILVRSGMRSASDAPINCASSSIVQAPNLIEPANGSTGNFPYPQLRWGSVSGAYAYEVQISRTADFQSSVYSVPNAGELSTPSLALQPSSQYFWRVRSLSAQSISEWSSSWSFTTDTLCRQSCPSFDGSTSAQLKDFSLPEGEVCIEWWNYVDSADVRNATAFSIGTADDANNRCQCTGPWSDKNLYWDFGALSRGRVYTSYAPYFNKWTHIALVSDAKNYQAIYLNGQRVAYELRADTARALKELCIGSQMAKTNGFKGRMSDFRIWNRVRSQEEILRYMNQRVNSHPNLLGVWAMDEGLAGRFYEASHSDSTIASLQCNKLPAWTTSAIPVLQREVAILGTDTVYVGSTSVYRTAVHTVGRAVWNCSASGTILRRDDSLSSSSISVRWTKSDTAATLQWISDTLSCGRSGTKRIVVLEPSTVSAQLEQRGIRINPQPCDQFVLIRSDFREACTLGVYNLQSQQMYRSDIRGSDLQQGYVIPCDTLPTGVYVLRVVGTSGRYEQALIHVLH